MEFVDRDIEKEPLSEEELKNLAKLKSGTVVELINPKSRNLKQMELDLSKLDEPDAIKALQENPKIMYRPILTDGERIVVGFKEDEFKNFF
jgi:arsenate reductase-like glutaredoxin family protein